MGLFGLISDALHAHCHSLMVQVLTYYTAWQLWRNAAGVVGTQRAAFVTQTTGNADIRVNYIPDTR